jgi:hypothetical protein
MPKLFSTFKASWGSRNHEGQRYAPGVDQRERPPQWVAVGMSRPAGRKRHQTADPPARAGRSCQLVAWTQPGHILINT